MFTYTFLYRYYDFVIIIIKVYSLWNAHFSYVPVLCWYYFGMILMLLGCVHICRICTTVHMVKTTPCSLHHCTLLLQNCTNDTHQATFLEVQFPVVLLKISKLCIYLFTHNYHVAEDPPCRGCETGRQKERASLLAPVVSSHLGGGLVQPLKVYLQL